MAYLLDTNICIYWTKQQFGVSERIAQVGASSCFLSEITLLEMAYGVARSALNQRLANQARLDNLQSLFFDRTLLIGAAFSRFAEYKARLRAIGRPTDDFDLLIGCTALAHGLTLVTRNERHFADLPDLRLEN